MKTLILSGLFLFMAGAVHALGPINTYERLPSEYTSEAVYKATSTCLPSNLTTVWVSSPVAGSLYSINITSAGSDASFVQVFDGETSTDSSKIVTEYIDGSNERQHFYNVAFDSYVAVSLGTPNGAVPCIDIIYRER